MTCLQATDGQHSPVWERLEPHGKRVNFPRNTQIYTPNEPADRLFLLLSGQVNLYIVSSGGRAFTIQMVEPGMMFGHSALVGCEQYDTFAESVKPVWAISVPREVVWQLVETSPSLAIALLREVGKYLLTTGRRLDEVAFKTVPSRLASVLLNMAHYSSREQALRIPHCTHQQLADMVNTYRETITKVINQFRADQLLDIDRRGITLLNMPRLRELAHMGRGESKHAEAGATTSGVR